MSEPVLVFGLHATPQPAGGPLAARERHRAGWVHVGGVLALENNNDIVPHLDSTDNPGSPDVTTVTFDNQEGSIGEHHAMPSGYGQAIEALDSLDDPSVPAYRASAGQLASAGQFLSAPGDGTAIQAQQFELDRAK